MVTDDAVQEQRLVQYLLGRVSPAEREEIQQRVLTDEGLDEDLLATADDLIHAYLTGALSREERSRFETHFLAMPRHLQRLAFVRDVLTAVKEVSAEAQSVPPATARRHWDSWRSWAMAPVLVLVLGGVVLVLALHPGAREARETAASRRPLSSGAPSMDVSLAPRRPQPNEVHVVRLPREQGTGVGIVLTPRTRVVRVEIPVDPQFAGFDAVVRARDGTDVWHAEGLETPPSGQPLILTLSARTFESDRYVLRVEGEPVRNSSVPRILEYSLRVRHER